MSELIQILQHIHKRRGMYFGDANRSRSIHFLKAFIMGFECGRGSAEKDTGLDCFREWVGWRYNALTDGQDGFTLILEHVGADETLAFDEFFQLLPDYVRDRQELGLDGIVSRFSEAQDKLWEAFRNRADAQ
jgi:hypothetical protein